MSNRRRGYSHRLACNFSATTGQPDNVFNCINLARIQHVLFYFVITRLQKPLQVLASIQSEVYPGNHFSPMLRFTSFLLFLLASCLLHPVATTAVNFTQCMIDIRHLPPGTLGGLDSNEKPVDIANATAITYDLCISRCGTGSEPISWSGFFQQFGAWLLPWLALISQLPFGARHRSQNLMSVLLAVGSPTLAAYSLALTVLNGQWIARRFAGYRYPNIRLAVRVLTSLQQAPLKITQEGLLASLIVLPENDNWWIELVDWLDHTHTWSISAASSIGWVVIAFMFTVVDSFITDSNNINSDGQGVGSVWLWLLPIVVGWLQISPKCDWNRLNIALNKANAIAHVAASSRGAHPIRADPMSDRAFSLHQHPPGTIHEDEQCTAPIYNYARFFPWGQAVEEVASAFHYASHQARANQPVNPDLEWQKGSRQGEIHPANRVGSLVQIEAYCSTPPYVHRSRWGPGVWSRCLIAAMLSIVLQWGTAGAAIIIFWFTPTTGKHSFPLEK